MAAAVGVFYAAIPGSAIGATFNDATGDHKFSTAGNWSGGLPGSGTQAKIGPLAAGTYTTDADMDTGVFVLNTESATPVSIALGAHTWTAMDWQTAGANHAIFDGGAWVATGTANPGNSGNGSFVCFTNGATMAVSGRTSIGWTGNDHTLFLSGRGTKWVVNGSTQAHIGNSGTGNALIVNDGAFFSTRAHPFNIGSDGSGSTVRVESGATADFHGTVYLGRGYTNPQTPAYAGKGENRLVVAGGHVTMTNVNSALRIGGRPCAPSNRVEVANNGCLEVNGLYLGAANGSTGSLGSSFNTVCVSDGGVVTGAVYVSSAECEGYDPPHGNVFTVGTNGSFIAKSATTVGQYGYDNGMLVAAAKKFDVSAGATTIGETVSASNNWIRASDTELMKFANLYCGGKGGGNLAEFRNVTNLVFSTLMSGQYSSNNVVTVSGAKSLSASKVALGNYYGSGNRMTLGVSETLDIPQKAVYVGYGSSSATLGDAHCADDCHLEIVGCGDDPLPFNPFNKLYNGTYGANCSFEVSHIETPELTSGVTFAPVSAGCMSNFVFRISGGSVVKSGYLVAVGCGNGGRVVVSGAGTTWTHGTVGANDGYLQVGLSTPNSHFAVEDGAEMFCGDSTAGFGDAGDCSITVGNDATLNVLRIRMAGANNSLVLSNGTLNARGECYLPYPSSTAVATVDNEILFNGTHPRLQTDNVTINLGAYARIGDDNAARDTTLRFVLPREGYANPPVESAQKGVVIAASTRMEADVSALSRSGGDFLLMRAGTAISIADSDTLASTLPENVSLRLKNDNKELWMHVPGTNGTVLSVR